MHHPSLVVISPALDLAYGGAQCVETNEDRSIHTISGKQSSVCRFQQCICRALINRVSDP